MNNIEISNRRLYNQQISLAMFKSPEEVVAWMCAMQAQDYSMAKLAVGIRLPDSTELSVESALDSGRIIRTHLLRPTWHFVSAQDIYWLLDLTAGNIRSSMKSRHRQLGLAAAVVSKSSRVIEKMFAVSSVLTRKEIAEGLGNAKIDLSGNRLSHLLFLAELEGLICSGPLKKNEPGYSLLADRVPEGKKLSREEALAKLAGKYFNSHGPATLEDFIWWSGLKAREARHGLEAVKNDLIQEKNGGRVYFFYDPGYEKPENNNAVYLLPAYDEFVISYRDRTAALKLEDHKKAISSNGIFRPVIVFDGKIIGIWKFSGNKTGLDLAAEYFEPPPQAVKNLVNEAKYRMCKFYGII